MDHRSVRKSKVDEQVRKRVRSSSFTGTVSCSDRQRLAWQKISRHRNTLLVAQKTQTVDKYAWSRISDTQTGSASGTGKGGKKQRTDASQHEGLGLYSAKQRFQQPEVPRVPGGSYKDPLNLQAIANGEVITVRSPDVREYDEPVDYNMPVNNFVALNQSDPLGLNLPDDERIPIAEQYEIKYRRKRVRPKRKISEAGSHSHRNTADNITNVNVSTDKTHMKELAVPLSADTSGDAENLDSSQPNWSGPIGTGFLDSGTEEACSEADEKHLVISTQSESVSVTRLTESNNQDVSCSSLGDVNPGTNLPCKSKVSEVQQISNSTNTCVVESESTSCSLSKNKSLKDNNSDTCVEKDDCVAWERTDADRKCVADQTMSSSLSPHSPKRKRSGSTNRRLVLHNRIIVSGSKGREKIFEKLKREFNSNYPMPQAVLEEDVKQGVAQSRKALKKALKIDPVGPEEKEQVLKDWKQKERDFKRLWRPSQKSSDDEEKQTVATSKPAIEALNIDTGLSAATSQHQSSVFHGPVSRTVDSIVSPNLRLDPSHFSKRRRTVSDCSSSSSSRSLTFCRSVSPESPSPSKRQRRQSTTVVQSKQEVKEKTPMTFAKNTVYRYGNYFKYYGYRTPDMAPDYRLQYFDKKWFEGKDVLDIGCNAGAVTLACAQLFHPLKIVGMDIDRNLIRMARRNITTHQNRDNMHQMAIYPVSANEYGPIEPLPALTNPSNRFPKNVMFMQGNYVLEKDEDLNDVQPEYDTILALSITKWIHLNYGDEGLKRAFARMFQQLKPGGHLVLEPQDWFTYRRRKKLTPTIFKNYQNIRLKPEQFGEYLINTVGFCSGYCLGQPYHPSKGFQRALLLFTKYKDPSDNPPASTPSFVSSVREQSVSIRERMANLAGYSAHSSSRKNTSPYVPSPLLHSRSPFIPQTMWPELNPDGDTYGPMFASTYSPAAILGVGGTTQVSPGEGNTGVDSPGQEMGLPNRPVGNHTQSLPVGENGLLVESQASWQVANMDNEVSEEGIAAAQDEQPAQAAARNLTPANGLVENGPLENGVESPPTNGDWAWEQGGVQNDQHGEQSSSCCSSDDQSSSSDDDESSSSSDDG